MGVGGDGERGWREGENVKSKVNTQTLCSNMTINISTSSHTHTHTTHQLEWVAVRWSQMMSSHFLCLLPHKLGKSKCTCDTRVNLFMNKAEQRRNTTTYNTCAHIV